MPWENAFVIFPTVAAAVALGAAAGAGLFLWAAGRSRAGLRREILEEMRAGRQELSVNLAHGQGALGEQIHRVLGDVNQSLGEVDRKWNEVRILGASVAKLNDVFEQPARRGRVLGEVTLERLLRDTLPPGYFDFQVGIGTARVDAVVRFGRSGLVVPIDSKFPAAEEGDSVAPQSFVRLAREIRSKYVRPDLGTTPFAYLYLPTEALWNEAIGTPRVWDELLALKVFPVSPHTLAIVLHGLAQGIEFFERGRSAKALLETLEARRREIGRLVGAAEDGVAAVQKAAHALSRIASELSALEASLALTQAVGDAATAQANGDDATPDTRDGAVQFPLSGRAVPASA